LNRTSEYNSENNSLKKNLEYNHFDKKKCKAKEWIFLKMKMNNKVEILKQICRFFQVFNEQIEINVRFYVEVEKLFDQCPSIKKLINFHGWSAISFLMQSTEGRFSRPPSASPAPIFLANYHHVKFAENTN
jgi:hypothetical protein